MVDRPRILHIVGDSQGGGVTKVVEELSIRATAAGYVPSVLTNEPAFRERLSQAGISTISCQYLGAGIHPLRDIRAILWLSRELRRSKYDVVHTHRTKVGYLARTACRMARQANVVHTVHGWAVSDAGPRAARVFVRRAEKWFSRWTDTLVCVSETLAADVRSLVPDPSRVVCIPNGIADPVGSTAPSHVERDATVRIVFAGRLAKQKGIVHLLAAIHILARREVDVVVDIFGDGPQAAEVRGLAHDLEIVDRVVFHGYVSDVQGDVAKADVVVIPSLWEGLSISLLEAMALGRPIVASSIACNVEVTAGGQCAMLVPPEDPKALADGIESLIREPGRAGQLAKRARERFLAEYTVHSMGCRYLGLYARLLRQSNV